MATKLGYFDKFILHRFFNINNHCFLFNGHFNVQRLEEAISKTVSAVPVLSSVIAVEGGKIENCYLRHVDKSNVKLRVFELNEEDERFFHYKKKGKFSKGWQIGTVENVEIIKRFFGTIDPRKKPLQFILLKFNASHRSMLVWQYHHVVMDGGGLIRVQKILAMFYNGEYNPTLLDVDTFRTKNISNGTFEQKYELPNIYRVFKSCKVGVVRNYYDERRFVEVYFPNELIQKMKDEGKERTSTFKVVNAHIMKLLSIIGEFPMNSLFQIGAVVNVRGRNEHFSSGFIGNLISVDLPSVENFVKKEDLLSMSVDDFTQLLNGVIKRSCTNETLFDKARKDEWMKLLKGDTNYVFSFVDIRSVMKDGATDYCKDGKLEFLGKFKVISHLLYENPVYQNMNKLKIYGPFVYAAEGGCAVHLSVPTKKVHKLKGLDLSQPNVFDSLMKRFPIPFEVSDEVLDSYEELVNKRIPYFVSKIVHKRLCLERVGKVGEHVEDILEELSTKEALYVMMNETVLRGDSFRSFKARRISVLLVKWIPRECDVRTKVKYGWVQKVYNQVRYDSVVSVHEKEDFNEEFIREMANPKYHIFRIKNYYQGRRRAFDEKDVRESRIKIF